MDGIIRLENIINNVYQFSKYTYFYFLFFQIKELSAFFRVVALDLKGFNDSDKPLWRSAYKPQTVCQELVQFIKSLGVHSAIVIGHDLGAEIG